jgi:Domain of unknown function (DUF4410)
MKRLIILNLALAGCAICLLAGCASTKVTNHESNVTGPLPRPNQIWVYDFTANPADIPAGSELTNAEAPPTPPTEEEEALGRQLGTAIATDLVKEIQETGMPAAPANAATQPQVNDIVIRGYLVSIEQGSTLKRMTIGFGSGNSELTTMVEGYQMTATGLRKLGSGTLGSNGSKGPGMGVGAATWLVTGSPIGLIVGGGLKVYGEASGRSSIEGRAEATAKEIGDFLKTRFQLQGWIN